jgi:taurine dehydrogenase small subunit
MASLLAPAGPRLKAASLDDGDALDAPTSGKAQCRQPMGTRSTGDTHATIVTAAGPSIDLLLDINAAFNARDVDRIMSFFEEDATFLMARGPEPNGRRVHGKAAIRKVLVDRFKVISGMRWDHIEHFVAGNRAVSVWMVTGTSADCEALNYQGCDIYEFRGDKILNKDTYWKIVEQKDRL